MSTSPKALELDDGQVLPAGVKADHERHPLARRTGYTKNDEETVLPLRSEVAAMARAWSADKPADERLWPGEGPPGDMGS